MANLKTKFIGLELQSPIIAGSCGLTADLGKLEEMAHNGVEAVILKSIFEEQINREAERSISGGSYPEEADYIHNYVRANTIQQYIDLVKAAKERLDIPVIGSINCLKDGEWIDFARELEKAGADALELNAFILPTDEFLESAEVETMYYAIIKHVKSVIKIPVIIKLGRYFTNLPAVVSKLKAYGADAVTIFNRFYEPDIDIEKMAMYFRFGIQYGYGIAYHLALDGNPVRQRPSIGALCIHRCTLRRGCRKIVAGRGKHRAGMFRDV